jgi:SGNH domain (fused to AT3 domains)
MRRRCKKTAASLATVIKLPPSKVFLSASWSRYSGRYMAGNFTDRSQFKSNKRFLHFLDGLTYVTKKLSETGHKVYVIGSTPILPTHPLVCYARKGYIGRNCAKSFKEQNMGTDINIAIKQVCRSTPGVVFLDPGPAFCSSKDRLLTDGTASQECVVVGNKTLLYRDRGHLTVAGSLRLRDLIDKHLN